MVTSVYSVDLSVRAAANLCLPTAGVGARIPKTWERQEEPPGTRRAGGSEARRARGATPAGGRHPLQPMDPSAPREVTEAFEGGSSLDAGLTVAGISWGDAVEDPPRQHRQEAGVLSRVGATSLQPGRSEAVRRFSTHGTAPTSTQRGARMRSFVAGGGMDVQFAGSAAGAAFARKKRLRSPARPSTPSSAAFELRPCA